MVDSASSEINMSPEVEIETGSTIVLTGSTSGYTAATYKWYESTDNGPILSIDKILNAIKDVQPKMVCLPNPDSPTGTIFSVLIELTFIALLI